MRTNTVADIRRAFRASLAARRFKGNTIDLFAASFIANEPAIFGTPNQDYIRRELDWYDRQALNINAMEGPIPCLWMMVANDNGLVNSNYGHLLYSPQNWTQYDYVKKALRADPLSRRATAIYTRPSMHLDAIAQGVNDFVCTNAVQYAINGGRLDAHVQMRSNDAVYGYKNDYAWQRHVQEKLAAELGVDPGLMYWSASSLHVYEPHFHLITECTNEGGHDATD